MAIFDIFKKRGTVTGEVVLRGLPPHKMFSVTVTFFPVSSASSPPPFNGDPPVDRWTDTGSVKEVEEPDNKPLRFSFQRAAGHYYLGVGVIAFLERSGKMFAQVERFFQCPVLLSFRVAASNELTWQFRGQILRLTSCTTMALSIPSEASERLPQRCSRRAARSVSADRKLALASLAAERCAVGLT